MNFAQTHTKQPWFKSPWLLLIGACALIIWLALTCLGVISPIHARGPDLSSALLIPLILEHALIGLILFVGVIASGLAVVSFAPRSWNLEPFDYRLLALPVGLILWLLICVGVRYIQGGSWMILILAYGLPTLRLPQILRLWASTNSAPFADNRSLWASTAVVLVFGLILSAQFAVLWRLPTSSVPGTVDLGDLTCYLAQYLSLKLNLYPFLNFGSEGDRFGFYFNQITSFLAFAFDDLPNFEIGFFLTTSVALFFFLGICYGSQQLLLYRRQLGKPELSLGQKFGIVLLICAATRYPSWIVESPPYAFAIPMIFPLAYLAARSQERPMFHCFLLPLSVILFAISKVVLIPVLGSFALCCLWMSARLHKSKLILGLLIAGVSIIALFSLFMLAEYGPTYFSIASSSDIGPQSLHYPYETAFDQGRHWYKIKKLIGTISQLAGAFPLLSFDISLILLLLGTVKLRYYPLLMSVGIGVLLCFAYPFLFYATATGSFALVAAWVLIAGESRPSKGWNAGLLFAIAGGLMLYSYIQRDPGKLDFVLEWTLCLAGALTAILTQFSTSAGDGRPVSRWQVGQAWRYLLPIVGILAVIAQTNGTFRPGGSHRNVVPPKLYDLWAKVQQLTPANALIFTDQTGNEPGRLEGWNDLSVTAERQFYISSWSMSPLRGNENARQERLAANEDVLAGRLPPSQVQLAGKYDSYFLAIKTSRTPPANSELIYSNDEYAIYKLTEHSF